MSVHKLMAEQDPSEVMLSFYEYLEGSELELKVNMLFNASCLLSAASNLQTVSFAYNERKISLQRSELENWYGCALTDALDEYTIIKKIEELAVAGNELPL